MRSTATPAVVTSAGDDTASRTMSVLSSVREHAHIPTNVCGGNVGGVPIPEPDITGEN